MTTHTHPVITITLSTDAYYGEGYDEIGITQSDLDRLTERQVEEAVLASYPEYYVEVRRELIGSIRVSVYGDDEHEAETIEAVEYLVGTIELPATEEALRAAIDAL